MCLQKALYGLRQAAWAWNEVLCELFAGMGFFKSDFNESLQTRQAKDGIRTTIVPYVHYMLIVGRD